MSEREELEERLAELQPAEQEYAELQAQLEDEWAMRWGVEEGFFTCEEIDGEYYLFPAL